MESLTQAYHTFFGKENILYRIFSPYRVCPIGAHVDHQHGVVTGFAIDKGIDFLFSVTDNGAVEMCSLTFKGLVTFNVNNNIDSVKNDWGDYLRGAVDALRKDFVLKQGVRGVIRGSMPIGGVSSSAALLCGFVFALSKANNLNLDQKQIIAYASDAERNYVGLRNGILDQSCVVLCKKNKLLFLDTQDESYNVVPFNNEVAEELPFKVAVFFSGVTRKLTGTDYNLRVSECRTAAWMIEAFDNIPLKNLEETYLRDIPESDYFLYKKKLPERFAKRVDHFFSECNRVKVGMDAWQRGDIDTFGQCMFDSCESSIYNYECGSPELIALYHIMKKCRGVYGGRFSGAGFKGACVALIDKTKQNQIKDYVSTEYLKQYPQYKDSFEVFFCEFSNGVDFV